MFSLHAYPSIGPLTLADAGTTYITIPMKNTRKTVLVKKEDGKMVRIQCLSLTGFQHLDFFFERIYLCLLCLKLCMYICRIRRPPGIEFLHGVNEEVLEARSI